MPNGRDWFQTADTGSSLKYLQNPRAGCVLQNPYNLSQYRKQYYGAFAYTKQQLSYTLFFVPKTNNGMDSLQLQIR